MSSSGRKERKDRKADERDWRKKMDALEDDLILSGNELMKKPVSYDESDDNGVAIEVDFSGSKSVLPSTRKGMGLFQPKSAGAAESGMDMDRTLFEMPQPENVDAMTDLIKLHNDGDKFPYIGIVGGEGEGLDARRARLLSIKPSHNVRNLPEIEVPGCPLIDIEGEFTMKKLMEHAVSSMDPVQPQSGIMPRTGSHKDFTITKQYVHIKSVTGLYTPNMSSTADFCKLWFSLSDTRMINVSKSGQSNALVSNQEGVMELSCDYCVSSRDLNCFVLAYTLEREILKPGGQWGTITFYFNISESDLPFQTSKRDALAVYRMPITTLLERQTNADKSDISFTSGDINALRKLFSAGDIVDVDQPQQARMKKSSYSKSTLRGAPKGEEMTGGIEDREGWGFMKGSRKPMMQAEVASVDVDSGDDDDYTPNPTTKAVWEKQQEELRQKMTTPQQDGNDAPEPVLNHKSSLDRLFSPNKPKKSGVKFSEDNF